MDRPVIAAAAMGIGFALGGLVVEDKMTRRNDLESISQNARYSIRNGTFDRDTYCEEVARLVRKLNVDFSNANEEGRKSPFTLDKEGCTLALKETSAHQLAPSQ